MDAITTYLKKLDAKGQQKFAARCGTTVGYLRKAVSARQKIGDRLCIALEKESGRAITCEQVRPDVDWGYLRQSMPSAVQGEAGTVANPIVEVLKEQLSKAERCLEADPGNRLASIRARNCTDAIKDMATALANSAQTATENVAQGA